MAPFLLPMMFQLGFGLNPFASGLLILPLVAGSVGMKIVTTRLLRRYSFRRVLRRHRFLFGAHSLSFPLACMIRRRSAAPVFSSGDFGRCAPQYQRPGWSALRLTR